ncbi:MAG: 4-(cytidine 5'-diphospho)-2-C-methyl-D-erythritol kinase [Dehalococcoidales bacterium]|nr:MAG: 4-(cytidine 5'-diphospho)-2-C-methyl-D-erythritol kinase [Dehalococcoidales bacterium]
MLTVKAPAKLNLTLEVLGKRADGYHEIRSVVQAIDLCDTLRFEESSQTVFNSSMPDWLPEESLVSKATSLLSDAIGCIAGLNIEIDKHIPLMSGLGGDSSDAAAVLVGLNRLWELDLSQEKLLGLAAELGSDVAFFLHGGTALMEGRGEVITPLPRLSETWVVLVVPVVPREAGKTGRAYAGLDESDYTDGQRTDRLVSVLKAGDKLEPAMLYNVFERTIFKNYPEIYEYRQQMMTSGADRVHLAGSGPTLFTLAGDKAMAEGLYHRLQQQGMETCLVKTLAEREQLD